MFKKIFRFFKNVRQEMTFVTWPSRDDLKEGTTVVIVMSFLVAIFLALIDFIFSLLIRNLLLKG